MTKLTNIFSSIALLAIGGLIFASCTSTTSPSGSTSTNLTVTGATTTQITVSWTRDASDNSADTLFVETAPGSNAGNSPLVVASGASATVTGLTTDVLYTIFVGSAAGRSTAGTYTIPAPPTNMMVNSMSANSIGAKWTRDAGDNGADTIVAMNGTTVAATAVSAGNTGTLTGLVSGTVYTISIHNATGTSNSIPWMPASRTTSLRIYETGDQSSSDPSALILGGTSSASSISGLQNADFVLESITDGSLPSGISFVGGVVHNSAWNDDKVNGTANYVSGGLDANYRSTDYQADQANSNANSYDIPNDAVYSTKGSAILTVTTPSGNLALVEIVPDPSTGMLYSMSGNYKYITVNVSYQSAPNQPYAARGHSIHSSGPVSRISAK